MKYFLIIPLLFILNCSKPSLGPGSDAYEKDKAFYESFKNPYTRADGSCVNGCVNVNGECVLDENTFIPSIYDNNSNEIYPKLNNPPGISWNMYWKRDFLDTPNSYPQYFYVNFNDKQYINSNVYILNNAIYLLKFGELNIKLSSGYTLPYNYGGKTYSYTIHVNPRVDGDTFNTEIFPIEMEIDNKNVLGYMHGKFSADYKKMTYYWEYKVRVSPIGDPGVFETYKTSKPITLDFH